METGTKWAIGVIVVALLVLGGFYGYTKDWFQGSNDDTGDDDTGDDDTAGPQFIVVNPGQQGQQPSGGQPYVPPATQPSSKGSVPVEQLNAVGKNKFTMAADTDGDIKFYSVGADVSDPYTLALDNIDFSTGYTTNLVVQTDTGYDVYYVSDGATNYDEKIDSWQINYNPETGKGYLLVGGKSYYGTSPVGAFVTYAAAALPEVQSGMNDTSDSTIYYDESALGGSGWFKADIGNDNANSELKDVVMCFRDNDGDMEGNEVTAFTASYVSGSTAISIPGSLQQYFEDAMGGGGAQCVKIADNLGSSQKARWQFTATVAEANFDTSEEFEISFDDLGDYLEKQYPSRSAKATAASLTIGDQA